MKRQALQGSHDELAGRAKAHPARTTRIESFTSRGFSMGGHHVEFQHCSSELASSMRQALVNFRPRRFLFVEPVGAESIALRARVENVRVESHSKTTSAVSFDFSVMMISRGAIVADFTCASEPAIVKSALSDPWEVLDRVRSSIEKAFEGLAATLAASEALDSAPWSAPIVVNGEEVTVKAGAIDNLNVGDVLGVYRAQPEAPHVRRYITTVEVESVGPNTCRVQYVNEGPARAMTGDVAEVLGDSSGSRQPAATTLGAETYTFGGLTVFTGAEGKSGIRSSITIYIDRGSAGFTTATIYFCNQDKLARFHDSIGLAGPYEFFLPIDLLSVALPLLRSEPHRFVTFTMSEPGGGGFPIGQIGFSGS